MGRGHDGQVDRYGTDRGPEDVNAFNAGDIDGLADLFEPEAVIIMPPGQAIRVPAEVREVFTQF